MLLLLLPFVVFLEPHSFFFIHLDFPTLANSFPLFLRLASVLAPSSPRISLLLLLHSSLNLPILFHSASISCPPRPRCLSPSISLMLMFSRFPFTCSIQSFLLYNYNYCFMGTTFSGFITVDKVKIQVPLLLRLPSVVCPILFIIQKHKSYS